MGIPDTASVGELNVVSMSKKLVENSIRRYLGYSITQPDSDYVHYLPNIDQVSQVKYRNWDTTVGPALQLPETPVRSITSVYLDTEAHAGSATSPWPSSSQLTEGSDFYVDYSESGFSMSGLLIRVGNSWPSKARSVKITYNAGWTSDEISGTTNSMTLDASPIRLAVLTQLQDSYNRVKTAQGSASTYSGNIKRERLADYEVELSDSSEMDSDGIVSGIPTYPLLASVREMLQPYRKISMVW